MAIASDVRKRKKSGGTIKPARKKRKVQLARRPTLTKIGEKNISTHKILGAQTKIRLLTIDKVNIVDPKTKKATVGVIKAVLENPANRNFIRRNIITKGAVVDTDKGKVKITSRPGQEGALNGVLI
ncbi:30S ribosomal protein S8e [Candidatus Woesearchaeota archaeon]|nr:MAG: small subunit ribosomal protein S8e [archaeon GW2011_AR4]MBS3130137.1 30S ribosomal protein S8e [Candidatus Woesearchaeota archaeon]HIH38968.1 30S ribosomal protein S8e [Candidatus Woesearchaeota archaeon]HIH48995.1 30S ribosomal protein S8e [Candidatus Woesearchaeota archaeon]HIJ04114.1 30S ribosomal protein S8e [Candidatus Woesearchaeota archaeon]